MQTYQNTELIFINTNWDNWFRVLQFWVWVTPDKVGSNFSSNSSTHTAPNNAIILTLLGCHWKLSFICGYLPWLQPSETAFGDVYSFKLLLHLLFIFPIGGCTRRAFVVRFFLLVPSFFMALCHLAHNTGTSEWPNVLTVSHHELLYETGLTAHKLKAILFTAISRFIDCLQPVTVLETLRGQAPKVLYVFLDVS